MPAAYHPKYSFTIPSHHPQGKDGDALLYFSYAEAICGMLANATVENTGLTIGIFGDWGMGKSSVLQMVHELLSEQKGGHLKNEKPYRIYRPLVVTFNAWRYSHQEELWLAFVRTIFVTVENNLTWEGLLRLNLELQRKRITDSPIYWSGLWRIVIKSILIGLVTWATVLVLKFLLSEPGQPLNVLATFLAGGTAAIINFILAYAWKAIDAILSGKISLEIPAMMQAGFDQGQIIQPDNFRRDLNAIIQAVEAKNSLLVLIDDLDRCAPDQIVSVLEAIKHFDISPSDQPGAKTVFAPISFVLAADRRAIERAVRGHFKEYLEEMDEDERKAFAREYIEKIVQVPFELPPLSSKRLGDFLDARSGFKSP